MHVGSKFTTWRFQMFSSPSYVTPYGSGRYENVEVWYVGQTKNVAYDLTGTGLEDYTVALWQLHTSGQGASEGPVVNNNQGNTAFTDFPSAYFNISNEELPVSSTTTSSAISSAVTASASAAVMTSTSRAATRTLHISDMPSATATSDSKSSSSTSGGISTGAGIGIGVGVGVAGLCAVACAIIVVRARRRKQGPSEDSAGFAELQILPRHKGINSTIKTAHNMYMSDVDVHQVSSAELDSHGTALVELDASTIRHGS
ncbi:hypothetical protein M406DRAFT_67716 [Cryphonectria parasitica EP155]|uniref:Uncharacterized protein n=1 Tax=Cryphonectria parasitica (strain ATCC 38755 / EP155) TaxID=660469 RepID=A0A9P4YDB6_CRYP1|nr:uncharacterized protein M406DRAFT_67716 [Cryphonectria parasitica EP155]KAF3771412.1 hypothetical protein M406DRAFT_67716 [Cryphonectria parasitica EP155]